MAFSYSVEINDPDHLATNYDAALTADADAAAAAWSRYITGYGPLVIEINIDPAAGGRADGAPTIDTVSGTLDGRTLATPASIDELTTGQQPAGVTSDITINLDAGYLSQDMWLNPTPGDGAAVPSNEVDGVSVLTHEIGHGLGFGGFTTPTGTLGPYETLFDHYIQHEANGTAYFVGPNAEAVYGGPVPLTTLDNGEAYAHVGNSVNGPLGQDLMNGVAFYEGQTYSISNVDLAILKDVGVPVTSYVGQSTPAAAAAPPSTGTVVSSAPASGAPSDEFHLGQDNVALYAQGPDPSLLTSSETLTAGNDRHHFRNGVASDLIATAHRYSGAQLSGQPAAGADSSAAPLTIANHFAGSAHHHLAIGSMADSYVPVVPA